MSEKEFYAATPKKLFKLAEIHQKVNNPSGSTSTPTQKVEEVYIDQISF